MTTLIERYRDKLTDVNTLLDKTQYELDEAKRTIREQREKIEQLEHRDSQDELLLKTLLWKWLDKDARQKVQLITRFYHTDMRIYLYYAMLDYVMTGQKVRFKKEVQQWHFRLFCEMIDECHFTVPSHTWLERLWIKVGLLKSIENTDEEEITTTQTPNTLTN